MLLCCVCVCVCGKRGFDAFLGFFEGGEDYYDHTLGGACGRKDVHDLWYANAGERSRPAVQPARSVCVLFPHSP